MDDKETGAKKPDPVAEVRKMLDEVTPGPWADANDENSCVVGPNGLPVAFYVHPSNRRFIAGTREGIPALLDTIEALQAEVARLREEMDRIAERCDEFHAMSISSIGRDPAKYGSGYSMVRDNIRAALKGGA